MGFSMFRAFGLTACGLLVAGAAGAADIPVTPTKLIVIDKLSAATKAKTVFVAKDPAATKGAGLDPELISVQFDAKYSNGSAAGAFTIPAGTANGWVANKATVAKFVNKSAPAGPTEAKVTVIKPSKILKLVGKGLGDVPLDILGAGDPNPGTVETAYCVTNDGETNCHCSTFSGCTYKSIAAGTGAKLVCKNGTGDAGCAALGPATTTTTTTSTSTSTTLSCPTCADWIDDPCNVDVCGVGCGATSACLAAEALDDCFDATMTGFSCCSVGAGTCETLGVSCPSELATCNAN